MIRRLLIASLLFLSAHTARAQLDFVRARDTTVVLEDRYAAGSIERWFFGAYYRDVWTVPVRLPVIDLARSGGGLTPLERGGGNQTTSLDLRGSDGRVYELRSVFKDAARSLPQRSQGTFLEGVAQDQNSSINPAAAIVVAHLARAAGLLHPEPVLVIIPDSPLLGRFRREFAGMAAYFEREPDEDQSDADRFGRSTNLIGSEKLFDELAENPLAEVDVRAYARARLFDMLVGDWDRHEGQWRWAEYETDAGTRYVPVPVDRDFAFAKFDGVMNTLGRLTGKMTFRRLVNFEDEIADLPALNWQGLHLDRRLAGDLPRADWTEQAEALVAALTDAAIDSAVDAWPQPIYDLIGPMTARDLKARRDRLPEAASRYFDILQNPSRFPGPDRAE